MAVGTIWHISKLTHDPHYPWLGPLSIGSATSEKSEGTPITNALKIFHPVSSQCPVIAQPLFHPFTSLVFFSPLNLASHGAQPKITKIVATKVGGDQIHLVPIISKGGGGPVSQFNGVVAPVPLALSAHLLQCHSWHVATHIILEQFYINKTWVNAEKH